MHRPLTFAPAETPAAPFLNLGARPRVAVLREQGVNSHVEMAYAFTEAGFDAVDVHMTDLQSGRAQLQDFAGVVACGGFSYRSEEHTSELQSQSNLVCRLLLEKKKKKKIYGP